MNNKGQTLIIALMVIGFLTLYTLLLTTQVVQTSQVSRLSERQESALWQAEAGIEKAIWCMNNADLLNCGGTAGDLYLGETDVVLGEGTFTTDIVHEDLIAKITSVGVLNNTTHTIHATISKQEGTVTLIFQDAAVAGDGGIIIDGGRITGGLYSNGPVICAISSTFTSDVTISEDKSIQGCSVNGTVKAHTIDDTNVWDDAYYTNLIDSFVGGIAYPGSPDQPRVEFLITDEIINGWKAAAAEGGEIAGSYDVTGDESLGPIKINGDLTIRSNKVLTIIGTIYVTGDIVVRAYGGVELHQDYGINSGVMVADGIMDFGSSTVFNGTVEGGLVTMVSMSSADPAISVGSGSENTELSLYSPYGTTELTGGSKVKGILAYKIIIGNGSEIEFAEGLLEVSIVNLASAPTFWDEEAGLRY